MRRFIAQITDTIATAVETCFNGHIVTGRATHLLRALGLSRLSLARLSDRMSADCRGVLMRRVYQPVGVTGAAKACKPNGKHALGSRWSWCPSGCEAPRAGS